MTKAQTEASEAANLIKKTAEETATALNIQYIQRDIMEIKQALKDQSGLYLDKKEFSNHLKADEDHENRIRILEKSTEDYPQIKKIIYGCIGFILVAFLSAVVYLIIPHH